MTLCLRGTVAIIGALLTLSATREARAEHSWFIEGYVETVTLYDGVNDGGAGQSVHIGFKTGFTGEFCDANGGFGGVGAAQILSSSTPLFAEMVRMAQTSMLSGKKLRIKSRTPINSVSGCKVAYMKMQP